MAHKIAGISHQAKSLPREQCCLFESESESLLESESESLFESESKSLLESGGRSMLDSESEHSELLSLLESEQEINLGLFGGRGQTRFPRSGSIIARCSS